MSIIPRGRALLNVGLALAIAAIAPLGCSLPPEDAAPTQSSTIKDIEETEALQRSAFRFIDLPDGDLVTDDPLSFAQDRFGPWEAETGNYRQELQVIVDTPEQKVIVHSEWGLADDSVAGIRTRLDFVSAPDDPWELVWVGQQFICHRGRGQQAWEAELCS
jgi:hypothetical protein